MLGQNGRAIVVVAYIKRLDARIGLQRQRAVYVRERIWRHPGCTIVVRLARVHSVARRAWTGRLTTGCYARRFVVPSGQERASFADRKVRLPLGLGRVGIGVQLDRRAEGNAAISRADVEDVAGVAVARIRGGIDEANYVIVRGRLAPAHVPPVGGAVIHTGEVARIGAVRACERGPGVGVGPGVTAVGGPVHEIVTVEVAVATILVHGGEVHVARDLVSGDLDVADEAGVDRYWGMPGGPVITGVGDAERPAPYIKIVPGNIHAAKEWRRWVVVRIARIAVVVVVVVNAEMGPASRVKRSGGLVAAQALAAARGVEPHCEPDAGWLVVQKNRIALSAGEGTLTAGICDPGEGGAAVGGARYAGDVDGVRVAAS